MAVIMQPWRENMRSFCIMRKQKTLLIISTISSSLILFCFISTFCLLNTSDSIHGKAHFLAASNGSLLLVNGTWSEVGSVGSSDQDGFLIGVPELIAHHQQEFIGKELTLVESKNFSDVENTTVSVDASSGESLDLDGDKFYSEDVRIDEVVDKEEKKVKPLPSYNDSGVNVVSTLRKFQTDSAKSCDIYDGRWVFDDTYPVYASNGCPFIDEGFSCEANGRTDTDYMKWRWQPNSCSIPRFDAVKMLELIRGKRLVFVGDSINRNQWESMLCLLSSAISDPSRVYEARRRKITKFKGNYNFKFPDYGCSVEYYVTHYLAQESKARVGDKRRKTLRIDAIDKTSSRWRGADILVFNSAHWWSHHKTKAGSNYYQEGNKVYPHLDVSSAFRKALMTWASWVDKHVTPGKTQVFFRNSAPSHFSGGEWNSGGHCKESTQPLNDTSSRQIPEKNIILQQIVEQMRTPVTILNITNLSGLRIDGHPSIYGHGPDNGPSSIQDCSHWCLPGVPDIWNELLYYQLLSREKNSSR